MLTIGYTFTGTKESPSYTCHLVFDEGSKFEAAQRKAAALAKEGKTDEADALANGVGTPLHIILASIRRVERETEWGPVTVWEADIKGNPTFNEPGPLRAKRLSDIKAKLERQVFTYIIGPRGGDAA